MGLFKEGITIHMQLDPEVKNFTSICFNRFLTKGY